MASTKHNLVVIQGDNEANINQVPLKRGKFKRLLFYLRLKRTSTMETGQSEEQWNIGALLILITLFGIIGFAFLVILAIGGFLWLDMKEDWRGTEAWRQKQIYDEKQSYQRKCELSAQRQKGLIEIHKQSNKQIPPDFLIIEDCSSKDSPQK